MFAESFYGSIKKDYLADFTVLNKNISLIDQDDIPEGWDFVVNLKTNAHSFRPMRFREDMTVILKRMGFQLRADAIGSFQFTLGASGSS